jgi:uncharacterized surface protein with fasciclin (FAS1) repeats
MSACNKALDEPLQTVSNGVRDTTSDIRSVLAGSPFHLFSQAYQRLALDSSYGIYTIFAATDSAMQAAGLTSSVIDALSIDSLYKIIAYQTVYNSYSDSMLENSPTSLQATTMREDVFYNIPPRSTSLVAQTAQQYLYIWKSGVLYVNGMPANIGEAPLKARNGWIWPVHRLFAAPTDNLWNIILSRPELSLYLAAYRLVDSFYQQHPVYVVTPDTSLFATIPYLNTLTPPTSVTIFAPTNDAFAKAGFHTVDDIRNYMVQETPGTAFETINGVFYPNVTNYSNMDSVLKEHYLYNTGVNTLMYQDLLNSAAMNNGWWNSNWWTRNAFSVAPWIIPYYSQFSGSNGTVNIQYSRDPSVPPAILPPDAVRILAINGIIYETDQLFYPHN